MDALAKEIANVESTKDIYSDIYNAKMFMHLWQGKVRWSKEYGGWLLFNGRFWERDNNDRIKGFAIKTHTHMINDIEKIKDKKYFTHLKNSAADNKLNAMLSCAKPYVGAEASDFDSDQYLLNCQNCIIDLNTGTRFPHAPEHLMTKISSVVYDPAAECPTWLKFLNDIFLGKQELIDFMQAAIGYSLSGDVREQCMFILHGTGRNGKSVFVSILNDLLGDYSTNCPATTFIRKPNQVQGINNDVARLKGARMVTASENDQNVSFDESMIKRITGGTDKITARFLNREFFDFWPTFKIYFSTNHKPNIRGTDPGIWRRIKMIPFDFKVNDANDDKQLIDKLKKELSGILNWALAGHARWRKEGLKTPDIIKNTTNAYREEEDIIGQFIKDNCILDPASNMPVRDFKDRLIAFCGFKMSQKQIGGYMEAQGFKDNDNRARIDGATVRIYKGLRFTSTSEQQQDLGWQE